MTATITPNDDDALFIHSKSPSYRGTLCFFNIPLLGRVDMRCIEHGFILSTNHVKNDCYDEVEQ